METLLANSKWLDRDLNLLEFRKHVSLVKQLKECDLEEAVFNVLSIERETCGEKLDEKEILKVVKSVPVYSFALSNRKTYVLGAEFGEQLSKTGLKLTWEDVSNQEEIFCLELPENLQFQDPALGACTSILFYPRALTRTKKVMSLTMVNKHERTKAKSFYLVSEDTTVETLQQSLDAIFGVPKDLKQKVVLFLNFYLYIQTGNPDLRHVRPPGIKSIAKSFRNRDLLGASRPYTLVGFNFKKPTIYSIDSTQVSGHFRWQPKGPGRSRTELVWVESHERVYNKS